MALSYFNRYHSLGYTGCIKKLIHSESENNSLRTQDHKSTTHVVITKYPERVIISEYSACYPISSGYLHPEIQSFKNKR